MKFNHNFLLILITLPLSLNAKYFDNNIEHKREEWVVSARQGEQELSLAIVHLQKLYDQTRNGKVRDDLIALLLRQNRRLEALSVCAACLPEDYSVDALENLARAARDLRQYEKSSSFYTRLQQIAPSNRNAWLGMMLVATEARDYDLAKKMAVSYEQRFGSDTALTDAQRYLAETSLSNSERLYQAQAALQVSPNDPALIKKVFLLASRLGVYSVQEQLIAEHPKVFAATDLYWLKHSKAIFLSRAALATDNRQQHQEALVLLNEVLAQAPKENPVYKKALQDKVNVLVQLRQYAAANDLAEALVAEYGVQPLYVQEAQADALMGLGRPFKALKTYQKMGTTALSDRLVQQKLIAANADAGRYARAQKLLDAMLLAPKRSDFTGARLVGNPAYVERNFAQIRLHAWRGNMRTANKLMDEWLASAPSDAWGWLLKGDIARWQDKPDDAVRFYEQAQPLLSPSDRESVVARMANAHLDQGNQQLAMQDLAALPKDGAAYEALNERLADKRAAQLSVNYGVRHEASQGLHDDEVYHDATLSSPQTKQGLRLLAHHYAQRSPSGLQLLDAGGMGLGLEWQSFPFEATLEAGRGLHLNKRGYVWVDGQYRLNQNWKLSGSFKVNSDETPLRALKVGVYANQLSAAAQYSNSALFNAGLSYSLMDLSDHNKRHSLGVWLSKDLLTYDRWRLNAGLSGSATRNKTIQTAEYYNPKRDQSASAQLQLSYRQPIDGRISVRHEITSASGFYWQSGFAREKTWSLSYGQEWSFGSSWGLGFNYGRKKSIYDGGVEYQNFGALHLNIRFN